MSDVKHSAHTLREALRDFRQRLAQLEDQIEALSEQRSRIRSAPVTRAEALAAFDAQLQSFISLGRKRICHHTDSLAKGREIDFHALLRTRNGPDLMVFSALLEQPLREVAAKQIEASSAFSDDALPAAEREKKVAEIDDQIDALEAKRERLIGELRAAGFTVEDGYGPFVASPPRPGVEMIKPFAHRAITEARAAPDDSGSEVPEG
jgi:hypothetical protein